MSTLYGWQNIGNGIGMALGPVLRGLIWTQTAPHERVPSCPEWRLRDLGFHVGCMANFWADVVRRARAQAARTLPHYMRPQGYEVWPELPLTLNGKVDSATVQKHLDAQVSATRR
jgi:hypothetical protein